MTRVVKGTGTLTRKQDIRVEHVYREADGKATVYVQLDDKVSAEQIYKHEQGHEVFDSGRLNVREMMSDLKARSGGTITEEQMQQIAENYASDLLGMFDGNISQKQLEYIWEEIFCDAFAGMNNFENQVGLQRALGSQSLADLQKSIREIRDATDKEIPFDVGRRGQDAAFSVVNQQIEDRYLELAKDPEKNAEKLQEMVKQAAVAVGYTLTGYHGTYRFFNEFKVGDIGFHIGSKEQAKARLRDTADASNVNSSPRVMELMVRMNNPLWALYDFGDWHGKNSAELLAETEAFDYRDDFEEIQQELDAIAAMDDEAEADKALKELLKNLGYDGIKYENQFEGVEGEYVGRSSGFSYIAFDSNQIKLADPVTYDDAGNVIPLSQRFNAESNDIRYSRVTPQQRTEQNLVRKFTGKINTDEFVILSGLEYNNVRSNVKSGNAFVEPGGVYCYVDSGTKSSIYRYKFVYNKDNSITIYDVLRLTDNELIERQFKLYGVDDYAEGEGLGGNGETYQNAERNGNSPEHTEGNSNGLQVQGEGGIDAGLSEQPERQDDGRNPRKGNDDSQNSAPDSSRNEGQSYSRVTQQQLYNASENDALKQQIKELQKELKAAGKVTAKLEEQVKRWKWQTKLTETATAKKNDVERATKDPINDFWLFCGCVVFGVDFPNRYAIIPFNKGVVSKYLRRCQHPGAILASHEMTRLICSTGMRMGLSFFACFAER